jgi:hypothetical protein
LRWFVVEALRCALAKDNTSSPSFFSAWKSDHDASSCDESGEPTTREAM